MEVIVCTIDIKIFLMYTLAVRNIDYVTYISILMLEMRQFVKDTTSKKLRGWELVYGKGKVPVEIEQGKGIGE